MTAHEQECTDIFTVSDRLSDHYSHLLNTITLTDAVSEFICYLVDVLKYSESINEIVDMTIKVSAANKSTFESLFQYARRVSSFKRPFSTIYNYDTTTGGTLNTVGFYINNCPSDLTNPLILIISDFSSIIVPGVPFYLFNISGYKYK